MITVHPEKPCIFKQKLTWSHTDVNTLALSNASVKRPVAAPDISQKPLVGIVWDSWSFRVCQYPKIWKIPICSRVTHDLGLDGKKKGEIPQADMFFIRFFQRTQGKGI